MDNKAKAQIEIYLRHLFAKRWYVFTILLFSAIGIFLYLQNVRNEYISTASIIIDNSSSGISGDLFQNSARIQRLESHQLHIESTKIAGIVFEEIRKNKDNYPFIFEIFAPEKSAQFFTDNHRIEWIHSRVQVNLDRRSNIIYITFQAFQAEEAQAIANLYQNVYIKENLEMSDSELIVTKNYLQDQKYEKERLLREAEKSVSQFEVKEGIKTLEVESKEEAAYITEMRSNLRTMRIELETIQTEIGLIEKQLEANKEDLVNTQFKNKKYFDQISQKITDLEAEKLNMINQLKENGISLSSYQPQIDRYDRDIKLYREKLQEQLNIKATDESASDPFELNEKLRADYLNKQIKIRTLEKKIELTENYLAVNTNETKILPDKQLQLKRLNRDVVLYEKLYMMITEKLEEVKIKLSNRRNNVKALDAARVVIKPIYPNKPKFYGIALALALMLSIGFFTFLEFLDNTIKTEQEIDNYDLLRLGLIPKINPSDSRSFFEQNPHLETNKEGVSRLISLTNTQTIASEAYRTIRTALTFIKKKKKETKTFLVTSCGAQEGKTTTTLNLATVFSQSGLKVLVIDADLRRPSVHSVLGLEKERGLTDILISDLPFDQTIKTTIVENLYVITSGIVPPNPSEILSGTVVEELISDLKPHFDLILFDTPPSIAVTDAIILSEYVDHSVLVVRSQKTERDMIHEVLHRFRKQGNNLVGVILNDFNFEQHYGYKYKYYNYYTYNHTPKVPFWKKMFT